MRSAESAALPSGGFARNAEFPRDVDSITRLVEDCFADQLDSASRIAFCEIRNVAALGGMGWEVARLFGIVKAEEWFGGTVWQEGGRVVGNVSITTGKFEEHCWLMGNVAVRKDMRGRGIGRAMVRTALDNIDAREGGRVFLQVEAENETAQQIYRENGFLGIACRKTWVAASVRMPDPPPRPEGVSGMIVRKRVGPEWKTEFEFLQSIAPEGIAWNVPLREDGIRPVRSRQLMQLLAGELETHWLAWDRSQLDAVLIAFHGWNSDSLSLFSRPGLSHTICKDLLQAAFNEREAGRQAVLETSAAETGDCMQRYGFALRRNTVWMSRPPRGVAVPERKASQG